MYIRLQDKYWTNGELDYVQMYLPTRLSTVGRPPSIGTVGIESSFVWPQTIDFIPRKIMQKLMGLAMELAVTFFFKNFCYTFGGKKFVQMDGGPIGARVTMAVARIVMQYWKDKFNFVLKNSNIEELLSGLYVDDGRSVQRLLSYGERYVHDLKMFKVDDDKAIEDIDSEIDRVELTRIEVLKAMNDICEDLEFTMELDRDFEDNKLPTLSFTLYTNSEGLSHSYYEKSMKNQTLVMSRSALGRQQIMNIMSNELIRRLEVTSSDLDQCELNSIVDKYTQQLVNSEYCWKQCNDIVTSGLKGWIRKEAKKKSLDIPRFRSGKYSLKARQETN